MYLARMYRGISIGRVGIWWDRRFQLGRRIPGPWSWWHYGICLGFLRVVWRSRQCQRDLVRITRENKEYRKSIGGLK